MLIVLRKCVSKVGICRTPDFGDSPIQSGSSTVKTDDSTGM